MGGKVPSTRRRAPGVTSTFQIGASALIRSMTARAPAKASPRWPAPTATPGHTPPPPGASFAEPLQGPRVPRAAPARARPPPYPPARLFAFAPVDAGGRPREALPAVPAAHRHEHRRLAQGHRARAVL